ncbi:MAG: LysR family transcriptional regulator [Oceanospirillaceae bacterium]|nr:LysR family transcriptional regulator [Oceanospirillaceae bacterium]
MLPDIKIAQINTFLTVAHCKNFRQAASILCRSQPAVSLAIKQLEQLLGAALFNPERHGELSAFGIAFLPEAKSLYKHYETTIHNGMSMAQGQSGSIKLGVLPSIAKTVLAQIMRAFLAQHPLVHLQVQDDNGDNLRDKVLDGRIDLAISSIWQTEKDLHHTHLCADRVGIVALKEHPWMQKNANINWEALGQEKLIRNGTTPLVENTPAYGFISAPTQVANMTSLVAMLEAGAGITTLPWMAFPKDSQELAFRLIEEPHIKRQIALLQSRRRKHMPVTKALESIIIDTFKNKSECLESPTQLIS